jgi:hypothetical protein
VFERAKTVHALDGAATVIGRLMDMEQYIIRDTDVLRENIHNKSDMPSPGTEPGSSWWETGD